MVMVKNHQRLPNSPSRANRIFKSTWGHTNTWDGIVAASIGSGSVARLSGRTYGSRTISDTNLITGARGLVCKYRSRSNAQTWVCIMAVCIGPGSVARLVDRAYNRLFSCFDDAAFDAITCVISSMTVGNSKIKKMDFRRHVI